MSWFDTTKGLASLAKTALKEAQKQIDKALDIQDEAGVGGVGVTAATLAKDESAATRSDVSASKKLPGAANREKSKTAPSTPDTPIGDVEKQTTTASTWGSFTGSFFEQPNSNAMVTTPPKATATITTAKRQSVTSNSDSVDVLTPHTPISPCSELASPSDAATNNSESVELITATHTSNITSPIDSGSSLPESIVIIGSSELGGEEDDEEDSMSFNTVMDDTLTATSAFCEEVTTSRPSTAFGETIAAKLLVSMEDTQTVDSDSTQSFEDVQMQTSASQSSAYQAATQEALSHGFEDDKLEIIKMRGSQTHSSPPNSNDEMDTTTSSDIEIISNPNGDSSSTHSATRTSPQKAKKFTASSMAPQTTATTSGAPKKGHCREPSEISILSEEDSEVEKLVQRISELNEVIETRELRLLQCERQNAALQERNNELEAAMKALKSNTAFLDSAERLSALEKKFQASIRERDAMRAQIKTLKDELQNKIPRDDLTQVVAERNAVIDELRLEGEKLSKEVLQQSNIIKKLRVKEKNSDALLKKNKEQIASLQDETERLKKTLNAKEEVERSQIEAVHKMSSERRRLDEENAQYRSKLEDLQTKLTTLQRSFEAVKTELQQRTQLHSDLTRSAEEALVAKKEKDLTKAENQEIMLQLNELREKLRSSENDMMKRERQLREENRSLLQRLEAAEMRAEVLTQEASLSTIPLIRQLESLQNTLSQSTSNWQKEERQLLEKLDVTQTRLKSLENVETTYKEKVDLLQARCKDLEDKLSNTLMQEEKLKLMQQQTQLDYSLREANLNRQLTQLQAELAEYKNRMESLEETNAKLEVELQTEQCKASAKFDSVTPVVRQRELSEAAVNDMARMSESQSAMRPQSPANSFGRNSIEDAMGGSYDWHDDLDCISNSGRALGMHINFLGGHNATTLEHLQSLLKQRDGEVNNLQWELARLQAERTVLNDEITHLTLEVESVKEKLLTNESLEKNFVDLQHRYDALLQMYGEKVERTEELELDLLELKEAYKLQIDELLAQPPHKKS